MSKGRLPFRLVPLIAALGLGACGDSSLTGTVVPASAPGAVMPKPAFGVNIAGLAYYGSEVPFVDLFKLSGPWLTQCSEGSDASCDASRFAAGASAWNTLEQDQLVLDTNGYPKSLPDSSQTSARISRFTAVATLVPTGLNRSHSSGRYIVLYDGEGTLAYGRGAVRNAAWSKPGRDVLEVMTDGAEPWFQLAIIATDPGKSGNHIRNIRVLPAGGFCSGAPTSPCGDSSACTGQGSCLEFEQTYLTQPFDPRFLRNLANFRAVRFMDYQNTNDSTVVRWSERTLPQARTWVSEHGDGGPAETVVALGNRLEADVWVNMPTQVDDDYVRNFAALMRSGLDKTRKVYVEYGNEAWNGAFSAGSWMEAQALVRWPRAGDTVFGKRMQWYGMRTAQVCDIWKSVWSGEAARVVCVMGSQAANVWTARQALDCPLWAAENGGKPCHKHDIQVLAIAPYFGYYLGLPEHAAEVKSWTGDSDGGAGRLFGELLRGGELSGGPPGGALEEAHRQILENKHVADEYGLELAAYEGGQHLVGVGDAGNDPAITRLFTEANRDDRMAEAYLRHLEDWSAAGGGLYNLWLSVGSYNRWGSWGLLEYRDQSGAPKYDAVRALLPQK